MVLEAWGVTPEGSGEEFAGSLESYFPLHDSAQLGALRRIWGNFQVTCTCMAEYKLTEAETHDLAHHDPRYGFDLQTGTLAAPAID